jgi:transcriptional regulator with AAA-type ATPase domain
MAMPIVERELMSALLRADSFEGAAEATLRTLLDQLAQEATDPPCRILRGMVHLRPGGGYRGLLIVERGEQGRAHVSRMPPADGMLPSLTAWRVVEAERCPVAVDVGLATAYPLGGTPRSLKERDPFASQVHLIGRGATHLLALPIRRSAHEIAGMISLEASCPAAIGQALFSGCAEALQFLADLAAPVLLTRPLSPLPHAPRTGDELLPVVGRSMEALVALLHAFSQHSETVLLSGPTGSGKSRLARWCHEQSPRRDGPFEIADLHAVPPTVQLGELFGWRRGAFTGATSDHPGWVEQAHGGTLFVDEIDKLSLEAQASLLQFLEERRYRVLGDRGQRTADVRFIIGTNINLNTAVKEGRFREDLYYRINVLPLHLPPLRERVDEIVPWAEYMLERRCREGRGGSARLSSDAGLAVLAHTWPGNLRQLDNVMRRAYTMALAEEEETPGAELTVERRHIERALSFERIAPPTTLCDVLREAGRAYALEAERRHKLGTPLSLELAEAFPGFVLSAAVTLTGSRRDAFQLYGLGHMVEARNHHRTLERALTKSLQALHDVGEAPDPEMEAQISGGGAAPR